MNNGNDITTGLISEDAIRQKFSSLLVDSIITDNFFNITVISNNILDLLEFTQDELRGKSIDYLTSRTGIVGDLKRDLSNGYFEERPVTLITKSQRKLVFGISGFYLGLISEINGRIIFTIRSLDKAETLKQQLHAKKVELDNFIYRAGHDLRGPLATIKGLINLLKIRENDGEVDRLVQLIDAHANKLDERLFQLVYLAQSGSNCDLANDEQVSNSIETRLRRIIEKNAFVDFLELHFTAPATIQGCIDCNLLCEILENLLLYILSLSMNSAHNQILYRIEEELNEIKVTIDTVGFVITEQLTEALLIPDFEYTDLVRYPQMINYYTAQKRADQLHSKIKFTMLPAERQRIELRIPIIL